MFVRNDLTEWVFHFVHDRKPENDSLEFSYDWEGDFNYVALPDYFTFEGEPIYLTEKYEEDDYGLESDAKAFFVLKKILHDGIIKTGWSFRKGVPTIYGPKSAACFTEMPLYALIEYAKARNNKDFIQSYGIAFLKDEIFEAGARPVIYGLSDKHLEASREDKFFEKGFRALSEKCGIGLKEMYRYVYTSFKKERRIDWTHEREWRWADLNEEFNFAGMPFIAKSKNNFFTRIIVFVKTSDEVEDILEHLQNLYHSKETNFSREYNLRLLESTYVTSLEDISKLKISLENVKFDDLPFNKIQKLTKIDVKSNTYDLVKKVIKETEDLYYKETEKKFNEIGDFGACGHASLVTFESNSEITQALIDLDIAHSFAKGEYVIYLKGYPVQSIEVQEYGIDLAAKYITKCLEQEFYGRTKFD